MYVSKRICALVLKEMDTVCDMYVFFQLFP